MKNYVAPDLNNLMQILKDDIMTSIKCLTIGEVQDFDPKNRTITAKIVIATLGTDMDLKVSNNEEEGLQYPLLYEVPVLDCEYFSPPIHEGDYCLLIFCDRNIDGWLVEDEYDNPPRDGRKHDINDAFAWFGIGNYQVSTFIRPDDYEPPHDLPEICDCPIPKYGYQPDYARMRYDCGEIDLGPEPTRNAGVTIVARDYTNVAVYAEGSDGNDSAGNIMLFPTNSVHVNNGLVNLVVHGDSDTVLDPTDESSGVDNPPIDQAGGGKISFFNNKVTKTIGEDPEKPDNWWAGKTVPVSDMYRIMAKTKELISSTLDEFTEVYKLINNLYKTKQSGQGQDTTYQPTKLADGDIMDLKARYCGLFAPADPIEEE